MEKTGRRIIATRRKIESIRIPQPSRLQGRRLFALRSTFNFGESRLKGAGGHDWRKRKEGESRERPSPKDINTGISMRIHTSTSIYFIHQRARSILLNEWKVEREIRQCNRNLFEYRCYTKEMTLNVYVYHISFITFAHEFEQLRTRLSSCSLSVLYSLVVFITV